MASLPDMVMVDKQGMIPIDVAIRSESNIRRRNARSSRNTKHWERSWRSWTGVEGEGNSDPVVIAALVAVTHTGRVAPADPETTTEIPVQKRSNQNLKANLSEMTWQDLCINRCLQTCERLMKSHWKLLLLKVVLQVTESSFIVSFHKILESPLKNLFFTGLFYYLHLHSHTCSANILDININFNMRRQFALVYVPRVFRPLNSLGLE